MQKVHIDFAMTKGYSVRNSKALIVSAAPIKSFVSVFDGRFAALVGS